MNDLVIASNILLWIVVLVLLVVVYALARQIGVLHERVAPVGALMPMNGPKIGELLPPVAAQNLSDAQRIIGGETDRRTFLFFLSPGCPVCKSLLPVVKKLSAQEHNLDVVYASDGETANTHQQYAREFDLPFDSYVLSTELGISLGVSKLPFAALIGTDGVLRARGLVNTREHLESLLTADEMDVSSLQEYLGISREANP